MSGVTSLVDPSNKIRTKRDAKEKSVVRIADVTKTSNVVIEAAGAEHAPVNASRTTDHRSDRPLVFYVWREQTGSDVTLMQMLPSQSHDVHETCRLHGHGAHLLTVKQRDGDVTEVQFKHAVHRKRQLELEVLCDATCVSCQPFSVSLTINIL